MQQLHRDAERCSYLLEMQIVLNGNGIGRQWQRRGVGLDVMVFVIMVGIGQADESRNVIPRGGRQVRVDIPIGSGIAAGRLSALFTFPGP